MKPKPTLPDEEWCFIQAGKYECSKDEMQILFRYELAREAHQRGLNPKSADRSVFESVFPGHFPDVPYLSIPAPERIQKWKEAFKPSGSAIPHYDPATPESGFFYSYEYLRHERVKPSSPQELANLTDDGYDQSFAMVKVNINFDYPDKVLSEAFSKMLRHIRKTQPVIENRGGTSVEDALKQLAASRLVRVFEGAKAAETFIGRHKYDPPYEGAGPSGWTKANSQVTKWLEGALYLSLTGRSLQCSDK